jgi:hypothetical protein
LRESGLSNEQGCHYFDESHILLVLSVLLSLQIIAVLSLSGVCSIVPISWTKGGSTSSVDTPDSFWSYIIEQQRDLQESLILDPYCEGNAEM